MIDDPKAALVRELWRLWAAREKAKGMTYFADDVFYGLYVPNDVLFFGGETRGKSAASDRFQTILDHFETVAFAGTVTKVVGNTVHGRVTYSFRHKASGQIIDGTMRQEIEVRDGLIVSWREYTDAEKVRAFMRLVAYTASE